MNDKLIEKLYLEDDYNCAETVLRYFNEEMRLGITEEDLKLVGGFGGGLGCGRTCGALCGLLAVLSKTSIDQRAHEDPSFKTKCAELVALFEKSLGNTECLDLKEKYFVSEKRCLETVRKAIMLMK